MAKFASLESGPTGVGFCGGGQKGSPADGNTGRRRKRENELHLGERMMDKFAFYVVIGHRIDFIHESVL